MSNFAKLLWTIVSYAPLYFVMGIMTIIDSVTVQQITTFWWIGLILLIITIISLLVFFFILKYARKNISTERMNIVSASSGDNSTMSSMIAYLLPLVTTTFGDINIWALVALIVVIMLMLLMTRAVFLNPLVYLFGYRYYNIQVQSGMSYVLLSKEKRFNPKEEKKVIELFIGIYMEV